MHGELVVTYKKTAPQLNMELIFNIIHVFWLLSLVFVTGAVRAKIIMGL